MLVVNVPITTLTKKKYRKYQTTVRATDKYSHFLLVSILSGPKNVSAGCVYSSLVVIFTQSLHYFNVWSFLSYVNTLIHKYI